MSAVVPGDGAASRRVFSVGELMSGLRELLEEEIGRVWVAGEISNLFRAGSGHLYFTLKDDRAQIRAALFRGTAARLPFDPEEGLEVVVQAEATVYAPRGDLQLIVRQLEPLGQGALQLAFEQLRARLEAEGLFDPAEKRPLPAWPRRVGVVTSPQGAAVRDVIQVSGQRLASIPLLVSPTRVQGDGAEREVVAALEAVVRAPGVDVVLLVRGGGSLEDLQAFNTEIVARAIRRCPVPVVVGVGHEVDVTIADLAADARAATPSGAAMLAFPDGGATRDQLQRLIERLSGAAADAVGGPQERLAHVVELLRAHAPRARLAARRDRLAALARDLRRLLGRLVPDARQRVGLRQTRLTPPVRAAIPARRARLGALVARLERVGRTTLEPRRGRLASGAARLDALSPLAVLGRGYAIAQRVDDDRVVRAARDVAEDDELRIRLAEGRLRVRVTGSE